MSTIPPASPSTPGAPTPVFRQSPAVPAAKSSVWWTVCGWLLVVGLTGAAWHYRSDWIPWLEWQAAGVSWLEPLLPRNKPPTEKKVRVIPVSTAVAQRRDMPLYLNGLGTVTAFKTVTIRSRVEGELVSVTFNEGEFVDEGKVLAEIDPRPYEVQLAQAESQLAREQSVLKAAKQTLSRYEGLLASKSISAQQVDDQATLVLQSMAGVQSFEAMIDSVKLQLKYCRIVAPISGRIGLRLVDQGNIVRANDPNGLAVITQLQPIALIFTIPQDDIALVQRRARGDEPLPVAAFDRDFKRELATGKLLAIDNQVDATTGTVRLKAVFDNKDGLLFPNQFVNARMLVDTKRDAVVVPTAAVQSGPDSMYVYVVTSDETVEKRKVVPGPSEGGETSIESGLTPGETIVTDGLDKLSPGAKVAPRVTGKDGKDGSKEGKKAAEDKDRAKSPDSAPPPPNTGPPGQTPKSKAAPSSDPERPRTTADKTAADQTTSDQSKGPTTAEDGPSAPTGGESKPKQTPSCEEFSEALPQTVETVAPFGVGCSVFRNWREVSLNRNPSPLPANSEKPNTRPLFAKLDSTSHVSNSKESDATTKHATRVVPAESAPFTATLVAPPRGDAP